MKKLFLIIGGVVVIGIIGVVALFAIFASLANPPFVIEEAKITPEYFFELPQVGPFVPVDAEAESGIILFGRDAETPDVLVRAFESNLIFDEFAEVYDQLECGVSAYTSATSGNQRYFKASCDDSAWYLFGYTDSGVVILFETESSGEAVLNGFIEEFIAL